MAWVRHARPPAPLVLLLVAVGLVGGTWAFLNPPWQSPDETWHFAYTQSLAEREALPGGADRPSFSTEQLVAADHSRAGNLAFDPSLKTPWSASAVSRWERADSELADGARSDGGGQNNAGPNPPLYYAFEAVPYVVAVGGDVFDRLYAMRVWSVLLLLGTVVATWLLAGELFGNNRLLQLMAAAVAGFQPGMVFINASVNPDSMLIMLWAFALWLGVRILRRGITWRQSLALAAMAAGAVLTKATGYLLVAAAIAIVGYALSRVRDRRLGWILRVAAVTAVAIAVPVGAWLAFARAEGRPAVNQVTSTSGRTVSVVDFPPGYLASYLWQFYLPKLSSQADLPAGVSREYGYDVWVRTGWGVFGWKEVRLPESIYTALRWLSIAVLLAAAVAVIRRRVRLGWPAFLFLALSSVGLIFALHWIEFRFLAERGELFLQGRYFLPLLPIAACAGAAALTLLPERFRGPAVGVALGGLFGLQVLSLATVLERYYA
jgi:4-amino-4-deoxy-L-arabinose transferase-like glycosyltransferase